MHRIRINLIVLFSCIFVILSCTRENSPLSSEKESVAMGPVYVTIYSHNEDTWEGWVGTRGKYFNFRANLVERLQLIAEYGAKLNWQTDLTVLEAMINYEDDSLKTLTNSKNILQYMAEDMGFSVDPHGHLRHCNYADLAHLIRQLDIEPSGVIGGLPFVTCGTTHLGFQDLQDWHAEIGLGTEGVIRGWIYPEAEWRPTILSVPGMPGHWFDELSSGVWRPGNGDDFYTHQSGDGIVYVGQGYPHDKTNLGPTQASGAQIFAEQGAYIKELVEMVRDREISQDGMLTASIHIRDCIYVSDNAARVDVNTGLREFLEEMKPLADAGEIVYVTYQEAVEMWETQYGGEPFRLNFDQFSIYDIVKDQAVASCQ